MTVCAAASGFHNIPAVGGTLFVFAAILRLLTCACLRQILEHVMSAVQGAVAPANHNHIVSNHLGAIEYRAPDELRSYANNPRKHSQKQIVKLMASIREFGFTLPVLVDDNNLIVAGEARVSAARTLGLERVPVLVARDWSEAKIRAYRLADNRLAELGSWDDMLLAQELSAIIEFDETPIEVLGWETAEVDVLLDLADDVPEADPADQTIGPPTAPVSQTGDLWLMGSHRLLCGSSLDSACWSRLMDGRVAAMAFSDPPYNVPISGHVCGLGRIQHAEFAMASGEMNKAQFTAFLTDVTGKMAAHVKDGGVLELCMDFRHMGELLTAIEGNGLSLLNLCVWNKGSGGMGSLYRSQHELVFVTRKGKTPHTNNVELGKHGRYRTNVWSYPGVNTFGKGRMADLADHPTVKPTALVADAIRDVTGQGEIVLDAFMGSGTTILAAERTRRIAYGIEIAPGYVDVCIRRWEAMTGRQVTHADTGETFAQVRARREAEQATHRKEEANEPDGTRS